MTITTVNVYPSTPGLFYSLKGFQIRSLTIIKDDKKTLWGELSFTGHIDVRHKLLLKVSRRGGSINERGQ